MIKTEQNLHNSVNSEQIFMKLSEQGSFFTGGQNKYNKCYAMIKTEQKS